MARRKDTGGTPWHPDFRNLEALPEVAVVRVRVFAPMGAATLLAGALLYLGYMVYGWRSQLADTERLQAEVTEAAPAEAAALALASRFQAAVGTIDQARTALRSPVRSSELLMAVARSRPPSIEVSSVTVDLAGLVVVRGAARGEVREAAELAEQLLAALRADPYLQKALPVAEMKSVTPTAEGGVTFDIELRPARP